MRRLLAAGFMGTVCLLAGQPDARAAEPAEHASALFSEGREAMKRGDYPAACAKFERSQQLDPSLGTLLNLGVCEARQGHLLRAGALLEQFLQLAEPSDDRRASAKQLADGIDARLARLVVQVEPDGLAEIRLRVDSHDQRFIAGTPFCLDPGRHEIELSAIDHSSQRMTIELAESEVRHSRIVLQPLAANTHPVAPPPRPVPPRAEPALPALFYVALGTGLAGALTIAGSGAMIANERSTVRDHCDGKSCDAAGLAAGERGNTLVVINTVAWPIAVVGASLAAYLVLFRNQHSKQQYTIGLSSSAAQPSIFFEGRL